MLEIAMIACIEARQIVNRIEGGNLPPHIQVELINEVLERSDCDGYVRLSEMFE